MRSVFRQRAQRNASRHRGVRQQSRWFAPARAHRQIRSLGRKRDRAAFRSGSGVLRPAENSFLLAQILAQQADLPDCSYVNGLRLARLAPRYFGQPEKREQSDVQDTPSY